MTLQIFRISYNIERNDISNLELLRELRENITADLSYAITERRPSNKQKFG